MMRRCWMVAGCLAAATSSAGAADRVKLNTGTTVAGQITEMTPTQVKVEVGAAPKNVAVNQIEYIEFDDEPKDLQKARNLMRSGKYKEALDVANKIKAGDLKRPEVKQDAEFYKAILAARLAMAGSGSPADAYKQLQKFESANQTNYHYFEACETLGDLLVASGKVKNAEPFYEKLAKAPWPDYRIKAAVLVGRSLEAQKQYDKAILEFEKAQSLEGEGKDVERQKLAAALGKATSLAGSGKADEAIKQVEDVIAKADVDNAELHARAYNALGSCFKAAGKPKDALLAYLHVDVLYSGIPEQHAEALANLASLWAKVDKANRAAEARAQLQRAYPGSRWAAMANK